MTIDNEKSEIMARRYVRQLKTFYQHLITYCIVNVILVIINLITDPHNLWFYWVLIFWGIAIASQAIRLFGPARQLNQDWEDRKVKEYLDKKDSQNRKDS